MPDPPVIAFLSTGRCGTQWLTATFRRLYPEVWVEHEPIGPLYAPRRYFRRYEDAEAILEVREVADHLARVERSAQMYIETGWPLFPALPLMSRRLRARLRVVHLTRHPVPSALSHVAHKSYADSPRADAYTGLATLGPSDPRVFEPSYASQWDELSGFEKCLFWWTEVHRFGIEFAGWARRTPILRVKSEELLSGTTEVAERLAEFAGLPFDARWRDLLDLLVDRWHHHTDEYIDVLSVRRHPATVAVARELGYDADDVDLAALNERYRGAPDPGLDRIGRF